MEACRTFASLQARTGLRKLDGNTGRLQKIECEQSDRHPRLADRSCSHLLEVWLSVLIEYADLTVDDELLSDPREWTDDLWIPARRILLVASQDLFVVCEYAVAVVLQLEDPSLSGERWTLLSEHQLD